jgi:hypothetical protein
MGGLGDLNGLDDLGGFEDDFDPGMSLADQLASLGSGNQHGVDTMDFDDLPDLGGDLPDLEPGLNLVNTGVTTKATEPKIDDLFAQILKEGKNKKVDKKKLKAGSYLLEQIKENYNEGLDFGKALQEEQQLE